MTEDATPEEDSDETTTEQMMLDIVTQQTITSFKIYDALMLLLLHMNDESAEDALRLSALHDSGLFMSTGPAVSSEEPFDNPL